MGHEKRYESEDLEVRAEGKSPTIFGYAARFNRLSQDLGGFRETISPGTFSDSIEGGDIRALFNHEPRFVLGRTVNDTLRLKEDKRGLSFELDPPGSQWSNDLVVSVGRGDINQMSFSFRTVDDSWETKKGENIRTLKKVELREVSIVTFPAYPGTSADLRSLFQSSGIDYDDLSRVLVRAERNLEITGDDLAVINKTISILSNIKLISSAEDRSEEQTTDSAGRSVELLRRRLLTLA